MKVPLPCPASLSWGDSTEVVSQMYSIGTQHVCLSCKISVYQVCCVYSLPVWQLYYPVFGGKPPLMFTRHIWVKKNCGTLEVMYLFCVWILPTFLVASNGSRILVPFACLLISFPPVLSGQERGTVRNVSFHWYLNSPPSPPIKSCMRFFRQLSRIRVFCECDSLHILLIPLWCVTVRKGFQTIWLFHVC